MKEDKEEHQWLYDNMDGLKEKIRFQDRTEYRMSGVLHNRFGPAIVYNSGTLTDGKELIYYIKGVKISPEDWELIMRDNKIKKIKSKMKADNITDDITDDKVI